MPDITISVPFLDVALDGDELGYRGMNPAEIELTGEQRLTLLRIEAGMRDAAVPMSARRFPNDAVRFIIDLVTAGIP
jgi:hypothetical protein